MKKNGLRELLEVGKPRVHSHNNILPFSLKISASIV